MATSKTERRPISARALYFVAPRRVELRELELEFNSDTQTLVHSRLAGVSHGSELLYFRNQMPQRLEGETIAALAGDAGYPVCYGYMNVGETEHGRRVFAFQPHQDVFIAEQHQLLELPDSVSDEDAVLLPSVETALSVVQDAAPVIGDVVAVFGQGVVGLLVAELLRRSGVSAVFAIDPIASRRARAEELGCIALAPTDRRLPTRIAELTESRGVDIAINTSAQESALQQAIEITTTHGTVVEASWYGTQPVSLRLGEAFHRRRITLKSSQVSRVDPVLAGRWSKHRRLEQAIALCIELTPGKYITHRYPLERAQQAFELLDTEPDRVLQVIFDTKH